MPLTPHMEDVIVYELSALGFGPCFEQQLQPSDDEVIPARIAAEHRGACEVWSATGSGRAQVVAANVDLVFAVETGVSRHIHILPRTEAGSVDLRGRRFQLFGGDTPGGVSDLVQRTVAMGLLRQFGVSRREPRRSGSLRE